MVRVCKIDGCGRKHYSGDLCRKHYDNIRHRNNYINDPDKVKAKSKAWNDANKGRRAKRDKAYAETNREHKLAYYKDYYNKNKAKRVAQASMSSKNRRARKIATNSGWVMTKEWWCSLCQLYNNRCAFCGVDCSQDRYGHPTVDHIIPLSRGGAHRPENIIPVCSTCNDSKQRKTPEEWGKIPLLLHIEGTNV